MRRWWPARCSGRWSAPVCPRHPAGTGAACTSGLPSSADRGIVLDSCFLASRPSSPASAVPLSCRRSGLGRLFLAWVVEPGCPVLSPLWLHRPGPPHPASGAGSQPARTGVRYCCFSVPAWSPWPSEQESHSLSSAPAGSLPHRPRETPPFPVPLGSPAAAGFLCAPTPVARLPRAPASCRSPSGALSLLGVTALLSLLVFALMSAYRPFRGSRPRLLSCLDFPLSNTLCFPLFFFP